MGRGEAIAGELADTIVVAGACEYSVFFRAN